jgi:hypothetical protein
VERIGLTPHLYSNRNQTLSIDDSTVFYLSNLKPGTLNLNRKEIYIMELDRGALSLRQTSTDLYPRKAMVYFTCGEPG